MKSTLNSKLTAGASDLNQGDQTFLLTGIPGQNPEIIKTLKGIAAQGARMTDFISKLPKWGDT